MSKQPGGTSFHMENFKRRSRYALVFILLILAFCVITVLNINTGNVHISLSEIADILLKKLTDTKEYSIIWKIRLPRILMAAILGGALSLSGFLLQTFFENPIAGPFVLGISSGAKMVVALTMIYYLGRAANVTSYHCSLYRFFNFNWIYPFDFKKDQAYGYPSGCRNYDRLYLLCSDRLCSYLCR